MSVGMKGTRLCEAPRLREVNSLGEDYQSSHIFPKWRYILMCKFICFVKPSALVVAMFCVYVTRSNIGFMNVTGEGVTFTNRQESTVMTDTTSHKTLRQNTPYNYSPLQSWFHIHTHRQLAWQTHKSKEVLWLDNNSKAGSAMCPWLVNIQTLQK